MNSVISVDTTELLTLAAELGNAAEVFGKGSSTALNRVAEKARKDTVLQITSQLMLTRADVETSVVLAQTATVSKPQAVLEIVDEVHFLSSYNGVQHARPNEWTLASWLTKTGGRPSILPNSGNKTGRVKIAGWMPRRGDDLRAIAPGAKARGISAHITSSGGRKMFKHVFIQPVLSGKVMKGRWGSFVRPKGGGDPRAIYGPSEYQAAKGVWRDMEKEVTDNLQAEVMAETTNEIDKALKTK